MLTGSSRRHVVLSTTMIDAAIAKLLVAEANIR
jgi:hypothetical protein